MVARHGWNSWDQYYNIHANFIDDYLGHFILADEIAIDVTPDAITFDGRLVCVDGLEIHVTKLLDVRYLQSGRPEVRTRTYSYHVLRRHADRRVANLFRYDNIHPHPGHADAHHRHEYDDDGVEERHVEHVGAEQWPTLGQVIQETHQWWANHQGG